VVAAVTPVEVVVGATVVDACEDEVDTLEDDDTDEEVVEGVTELEVVE
jgi:hypothetical protein